LQLYLLTEDQYGKAGSGKTADWAINQASEDKHCFYLMKIKR
jgi:hypothetical protein